MINSEVRCAMVTINPFPIGNVATIRYSSYMSAIAKAGCFSKVYIYAPTRTAKANKEVSGIHNGVHYEYTSGKITLANRNIVLLLYYMLVGLLKCGRSIVKDNINVLIVGNPPLLVSLYLKILCKIYDIRFYGERSELPYTHFPNNKIKQWIYAKKIQLHDGMILMTDELIKFYSGLLKGKKPTFLLPMTIDCHRFDNVRKLQMDYEYIAVVFGVHNRDGLLDSIKSYNRYRELGGIYHLQLIGNYECMPNRLDLDKEISNCKYKGCIHICGVLQSDKLPQILKNASCLMTTPQEYISGGFPTKLGEYMLSGVPIVATAAGDVLKYVENNSEIKFSEPSDVESIARSLLYVEQNREENLEMANRAEIKARKVFNAETYIPSLLKFLIGS